MRVHAQRMNIGLHHVMERLEYHAVALDSVLAHKGVGNNPDLEMSLAIPGTRMARVQVALVLNPEIHWRKRRLQKALNTLRPIGRHGNMSLNGLTVTCR